MTHARKFQPRRLRKYSGAPRAFSLFSLSLLVSVLFVAPAAPTPFQQDDDEVVRVESDLVVLNVTVKDDAGKYIHKLTRRDFRVFEDGLEQTISTFSPEETPFAAAILLDSSGSMEGRMSLARSAAIRFLDGLRENDVTALYRFDTEIEQMQDFSSSRDLPHLAFDVRARGMTALNDAVRHAADDLSKRPETRRAIVILSDGADTRSNSSADKAFAAALAANVTIYTVDLSNAQDSSRARLMGVGALRNYAQRSGGRYLPTPGGQSLSTAFADISEELRNQYTIGYRPANRARDGRFRTIQVKLARPELVLRTRRGYHAPR